MTYKPENLPDVIIDAIDNFRDRRWPVGGFLSCVLENDLGGAAMRADKVNRANLADVADYVRFELPDECHGSATATKLWIESGKDPRFKGPDGDYPGNAIRFHRPVCEREGYCKCPVNVSLLPAVAGQDEPEDPSDRNAAPGMLCSCGYPKLPGLACTNCGSTKLPTRRAITTD